MIGRGLTAIDFLYNMTDGDLHEVKNEGVTNQA